jgi:hypothetical protein
VLADAEVVSEHVLLALTARWDGSFAASWLQRCGIDPVALRQRVVEFTEGGQLPAPPPAAAPMGPAVWDPASGLELAPTPDGKDPRRRRPWGLGVVRRRRGQTAHRGGGDPAGLPGQGASRTGVVAALPAVECVAALLPGARLRSGQATLTSCTPTTACDCGLMWETLRIARLRSHSPRFMA